MADYAISNVPRRVVYAASGVGPYAFTFEILVNTDVAVYKDNTLLTLTTDYTVTIAANGTGSITLVASPTGATQIAIVGSRAIQRTSDFVTGGDFFANTVNDELDSLTIFAQQNAEGLARALQIPQTDPTGIDMTLPRRSDRAGKYLVFDANGEPAPGEIPPEVAIVAGIEAQVVTVAGGITNINTVATNISSVNSVATNIADVNVVRSNIGAVVTVGSDLGGSGFDYDLGSITDPASGPSSSPDGFIQTVVNNLPDITDVADNINGSDTIGTVAGSITNVNSVGTNISNVNAVAGELGAGQDVTVVAANLTGTNTIGAVAGSIANVDTVAASDADIGTIADNLNGADTIGTVATNIANVNAVGTNISNVNAVNSNATNINTVATDLTGVNTVGTVAGIAANVTTVAGISANVTSVAGNSTNINAVAGNATNIDAVAGNATNINTVAGISANVSAVAAIDDDVTTVATNLADVTNFADVYLGPKTSDPTLRNDSSALQAGDLYFNTTLDEMRVYSGSTWDGVSTNRIRNLYKYLATAGQTTFTGTDANTNVLAYTPGALDVFLNGVRLDESDFTATNGTSVVLASAAALNDELNIIAFGTFDVTNFNGTGLQDGTVSVAKLASTLDLGVL
jgi:hypothetical protein